MSSPDRRIGNSLWRGVLRKPLGVASLIVIAVLVVSAVGAPWLAPYSPLAQDPAIAGEGPSLAHLLGTDMLGRDILSRLMYGGQDSLMGVVIATAVMLAISVPLGVIAAYVGGVFDRIVMSVVDIVLSIPNIIITLAVLAIFRNDMTAAMITVGVLASGAFTRIFRSAVVATRREPFVSAAIVTGLRTHQIIGRHILPHAAGTILVQASLFAAAALGIQTGLAFLGFGPPPPAPTWGGMVAEAATVLPIHPWMLVPTGGVIAIATLAFGLLGDALRDANAERYRAGTRARGSQTQEESPPTRDAERSALLAGEPLLAVRDLDVVFGRAGSETRVVDGVTFDLARGEVLGLVGESGSGKTVTALSLLGLLAREGRIANGSIRFDGVELVGDARAMAGVRGAGIGYIPQEPMVALDPSFKIGTQIVEVVRRHDRSSRAEAKARAIELLTAVQLGDPQKVFRSYPHQVSGGMAQRVVIAKALAARPRLMIADEPTTALDVTVQAEILALLRRLQRENGMSMILVSHDWGVVSQTCDRAMVMYAGQLVESAAVAEIITAPRHPYTRGLLASDPHGARRGDLLPTIGGSVPQPGAWPHGCRFAPRCPLAVAECREGPDRAARPHSRSREPLHPYR